MCGLSGFCLSPDENIDARALSTALLLGIEERGRHATGMACFEGTQAYVQKAAVPATKFVRCLDMAPTVTTALLHTRWATKGSPKQNENNHPIDVDGIIGVHNGCCFNDDDLFDRIGWDKRKAEVDSEAIFATLNYGNEKVPQALSRVEGSAAVAWIESEGDPHALHASRISSSPFVYGFTEAGSFIFASTHMALSRGVKAAGVVLEGGPYTLAEGTYIKVRHGEVVLKQTFQVEGGRSKALTQMERIALNLA